MFTRIFKSDYIFQLIFILIVSLVIYIALLFHANNIAGYTESPMMYFANLIFGENRVLIITVNFILLIFQALLFKRILSSNDLLPKNNLLPALLYFVIFSGILKFGTLQPVLFVNLFIILALQIILTIYNKAEDYINCFNLGILISIASLFYFPSIIFFIFIILSFLVYSLLKWREWIITVLGLFTTYILYFGIAFLLNILELELLKFKHYFHNFYFHPINIEKKLSIFLLVMGLLFVPALFTVINKLSERSIYYRKKVIVLFMFFLVCLLSFLFNTSLTNSHICMSLMPVIFFISAYLSQLKNNYVSEIFYFVLFGAITYNFL